MHQLGPASCLPERGRGEATAPVLRTVLGYLIYFYINEWIDKCFDGWSKICSIYIYTYMKQVDELWINESMSKGKNKWQISGRMDRWIDK